MVAVTAEELLQVVVRPRQISYLIAVEQTRPVTPGHLPEVLHGGPQLADPLRVARHRSQEPAQPTPPARGRVAGLVAQQVRCLVGPTEGDADRRPPVGGGRQPAIDPSLQPFEFPREPFFSSTRPRLVEITDSRSCSFSPAASKGGRPSSVSALRTALQ